jgi:hypothetical protein
MSCFDIEACRRRLDTDSGSNRARVIQRQRAASSAYHRRSKGEAGRIPTASGSEGSVEQTCGDGQETGMRRQHRTQITYHEGCEA